MKDNDIFNFLKGFAVNANQETKSEVLQKYIDGKITKEEFLKRMRTAR